MSIAFNPVITTNAPGSFNTSSEGYIQGTALNDPAIRNQLAGGYAALTDPEPFWGGVAISENIPTAPSAATPHPSLGGALVHATQVAGSTPAAGDITGFTVFDQDHSMINTPQSPVPLATSGMGVNFYRLGTGARIAVACDPSLVDLEGNIITQQVSWDFDIQALVPFEASEAQIAITSQTWSNTGGGQVAVVTAAAHNLAVGDHAVIAGAVPAGYNGDVIVTATADNTHFIYALAVEPGGVSPATTAGHIVAGGGLLPVRVLDVNIGNSMTVVYDPVSGFATWNRSGSCAIILI
jgi:hypothetical protein